MPNRCKTEAVGDQRCAYSGNSHDHGRGLRYWQSNRYLESTNDAYVGGDVTVIAPKVVDSSQNLVFTEMSVWMVFAPL